jgi:DNA processing protein
MSTSTGILQLVQAKGIGVQAMNRILNALREDGGTPADLASASPGDLLSRAGLRSGLSEAIEAAREPAALLADELEEYGIQVLAKGFDPYPIRLASILGDTAPPILFVKGDLELFRLPAVGFCGSRKASDKGLAISGDTARELALAKVNVVSGYANGVDLAAHRGALEAGGTTTLVLAEGILHFRPKQDIAALLEPGRFLIVSEFPPRLKWLAPNAMQRNRTICALSDAVVVVESGLDGGTFAAGETALEFRRPLFVVEYAAPPPGAEGNRYFLEHGGLPLHGDRDGKANLTPILNVLNLSGGRPDQKDSPTSESQNGTSLREVASAPSANHQSRESPNAAPQMEQPAESHKRLPEASHRSRSTYRTNLGACSARKVDPSRAYFDAAHLVGAAAVGGVSGGHLCGALARSRGRALPAVFPRRSSSQCHRIRQTSEPGENY